MASNLALTTTFTPSASCLSNYYRLNHTGTYTGNGQTLTYQYMSLGPASTSACVPKGFDSTSQYYSPGVCPSGYYQACSLFASFSGVVETQATCCPSGYTCQKGLGWPWYSTEACTQASGTIVATITSTLSGGATTRFVSSFSNANAYGISIRYKDSDRPASTTSTTSTTTTSSSSSSLATNTATETPNPDTTSSAESFPVGAIAGISVAAVCVLLILGMVIWWIRKSKLDGKGKHVPLLDGQPYAGYPEYPNNYGFSGSGSEYGPLPNQGHGYMPAQLPAEQYHAELPSGGVGNAHELDTLRAR